MSLRRRLCSKFAAIWSISSDISASILHPVISGGGQEFGFRSGTENVAAIVGFAKAIELISEDRDKNTKRVSDLKSYFLRLILKKYPKAKINGGGEVLPHIANMWLPGVSTEEVIVRLDLAGVAISAGPACSARSTEPSRVLLAMGQTTKRAKESIRVSFGRETTVGEIKLAVSKMGKNK
jgi:cysteine desulfurase